MNRVTATAALLEQRLPELDDTKRAEIDKILALDPIEFVALQNAQSRLHAQGFLNLDEAQTMYQTLNHWDRAPVTDRLAVISIVRLLL